MKRIKFLNIEVPTVSSETQALGILFQLLSEILGILTREKKSHELEFFIRERLDNRERRTLFSILNQLQVQVGQKLDTLKGQGNVREDQVLGTKSNDVPFVFNKAQELLHLCDDFANRQVSSSVDLARLEELLEVASTLVDQRLSRSSRERRRS